MTEIARGLILAIGLLIGCGTTLAKPPVDLDAYASRAMRTFGPPGMSLVIVEGDKIYTTKSMLMHSMLQ